MLKLQGYEPGANLTVLNVFYKYPYKDTKGKWQEDFATIVYKDNDTGVKKCETIKSPEYTYYIAKPEIQITHNMAFIESDLVDPVTCKYRDVVKSIAQETGNIDLFNDNIKTGNYGLNRLFFTHPRIFSADMNIQNYIRSQFAETYKNPVCDIDIAFYDIETDMINALTDNIVLGECPVNAISLYYTKTNTVYSFVLRNDKNPQIAELEDKMKNDFSSYQQKVRDFIEENLGSHEKVVKYKLVDLKLSVGFFNTEEEMIITFFNVLKELNPDFAAAYNAAFDLPYLIERLKILGLDPLQVICNKEFSHKFCNYIIDTKNQNKFEERCDYAEISSFITYIDQLIIYASRRKGQSANQSYSLDSVGDKECKVKKLDYHHITTTFAKFSYLDFYTFWLYNINDTIVQACIEAQTEDIKYMFNNTIEMNTPYHKIFRQTNYLGTKGVDFYKNHENVIMGNNINRFGKKPEDKFPGAFVADPKKMSVRNKVRVNGYPIYKYNNGNDFDYKRLYPSLLQEFNMAVNTQIGKIIIDNAPFSDPDYLRLGSGGSFTENLASYNFIEFCHRWLNMADIEQMLKDVNTYFSEYRTPMYKLDTTDKLLPYDTKHKVVIYQIDKTRPVSIEYKMPEWVKQRVDEIRGRIKIG